MDEGTGQKIKDRDGINPSVSYAEAYEIIEIHIWGRSQVHESGKVVEKEFLGNDNSPSQSKT